MTLPPLHESESVQRLLRTVPASMRRDAEKTLRLVQFNAWLMGWEARFATQPNFPPLEERCCDV